MEFLVSKRADPQLGVDAAIQSGNSSITHYLIEKGALVENPILLKSASKNQNIELAKVLLETRQMDPDAIMLDLIALKDAKLVETNLSYGAQADAAALRAAVDSKSEEIALKLIERAADDLFTNTLIFNAVKNGMPQVVSHLIDRVSNPDYAYKAALETKQVEMLNLSIAKGAMTEDQDLFRVMRADFQEAVPVLLDAGLDPKVLDLEGNTLLHYVVFKSDKEDLQLIEDLLDYGLNINAKNKIGETPLHWAVKGGNQNTEIIKKLLANGGLVEAQTIKRQTVYDYAEDKSIRQLLKESLYR